MCKQIKEQLKFFLVYLIKDKKRKIKIILFSFIFLLWPAQNYYVSLNIPKNQPVVRPAFLTLSEVSSYPVNITGNPAPTLTAISALVVDAETKTIIYAKQPDIKILPASTTKIMTALIALDQFRLDDVLEIKSEYTVGQVIGFKQGEKFTFENMLYALMVASGNDVANALAENYPGGEKAFVAAMNAKAKQLNLFDTNFINPTGVEDNGHITSAHDLAILSSEAIKNETFLKIVSTQTITIADVTNENKYALQNINQLLGKVWGLKGIKTGWTENAGQCLVTFVERDKGKIITVVLGSQDRFTDTENVINWVYENFNWETIKSIHY